MYNNLKYLKWDSDFFGFKIGRMDIKCLDKATFSKHLSDIKEQSYKLVYFFVDPDDQISNKNLIDSGASLVDQKIIFEIDLNYIKCIKPEQQNIHQIDINSSFNLERLEAIALQCGEYSRFYIDKNFGYELYARLYKEWLHKSIKKDIADQVFIYEENDLLTGFISVSKKEKEGNIGLLCVDKMSRGKSIGKKMIYTVFDYLIQKDIMKVNVATQLNNISGCNFYKNVGFTQTSVTNIYHYWFN